MIFTITFRWFARLLFSLGLVGAILLTSFSMQANAQANGGSGVDKDGKNISPERAPTPEEALTRFTENVTERSKNPDRIYIGNHTLIRRGLEAISKSGSKTLYFIGEAGAGKTAVVEEIASRLPPAVEMYQLDLNKLKAGTSFRGELEDRTNALLDIFKASNNSKILFIDEIHLIKELVPEMLDILKPSLAKGEITLIGATTLDEFKIIESDKAMITRGQVLTVDLPTIKDVTMILRANKAKLLAAINAKYGLSLNITDRALETAARLAWRYSSDDSKIREALKYIDGALTRRAFETTQGSFDSLELEAKVQALTLERDSLKADLTFETNDFELQERFKKAQTELDALENQLTEMKQNSAVEQDLKEQVKKTEITIREFTKAGNLAAAAELTNRTLPALKERLALEARIEASGNPNLITEREIEKYVKVEKGLENIGHSELDAVKDLAKRVNSELVGQEHLAELAERALRIREADVTAAKGPKLKFLLLGPTGVGKTEFFKLLAKHYMGDPGALMTINMTQFTERHSVSTLNSPPAGYEGSKEGGVLTEPVRRRPRQVVYLDEMGSEHRDVTRTLMDPLEEGKTRDGNGRMVDFTETIIGGSSNIGSDYALKKMNPAYSIAHIEADYGFPKGSLNGKSQADIDDIVGRELLKRNGYAPEFINRFDVIAVANGMSIEMAQQVAKHQLLATRKHMLEVKGIDLRVSENAIKALALAGYDAQFGARPIQRKKKWTIELLLADLVLESVESGVRRGSMIVLDFIGTGENGGKFVAKSQNGTEKSIEVSFTEAKAEPAKPVGTSKTGLKIPKSVERAARSAMEAGEAGKPQDPTDRKAIIKRATGKGRR